MPPGVRSAAGAGGSAAGAGGRCRGRGERRRGRGALPGKGWSVGGVRGWGALKPILQIYPNFICSQARFLL